MNRDQPPRIANEHDRGGYHRNHSEKTLPLLLNYLPGTVPLVG